MKLIYLFALLLASTDALACTTYTGPLQLIDSHKFVYGVFDPGASFEEGDSTHLLVSGHEYVVQFWNFVTWQTDEAQCNYFISFHDDPIFANGNEVSKE